MQRKLFCFIFLIIFNFIFSQEKFTVYFDSGKFDLKGEERDKLRNWILENKNSKVVAINGYADEVGTTVFNDSLAQKRVDCIFETIKNQVKIREDFKTRSFGEHFLQSKNKAENRKVILYYILEKDLSQEDEILGIKKEIVVEEPKAEIEYPEKLVFENPNGSKVEFKLNKDFMKKVGEAKVGEKLKMENLNFVINTFIVESESRGKLYELLIVLQKNPKLKIEIQGHLCCQPIDRFDLSTQRSKAIYNFLIFNGINKKRLSYKGFGSSMPIYPLPEKNEQERAANRRVEILIIEN